MKTLTLILALVSLPAFADEILPLANPAVNQDTCLTSSDRTCPDRMDGYSPTQEQHASPSASPISVNASSYRGPRGIPDSMLNQANPEFVNTRRSTPHYEASFSWGVASF